jgi:probable rRNA maturation factor
VPLQFGTIGCSVNIKNRRILKTWITKRILSQGKLQGNISIVIVSDNKLLKLNKEFLNRDYLTDIITFDYSENQVISGDLFISIDRIKENADIFKSSPGDELKRVIIHGILHLLGYNDSGDNEKKIMRNEEDKALDNVKDLIIL